MRLAQRRHPPGPRRARSWRARGAEALARVAGRAALELRRSEPGEAAAQWALISHPRENEAPESGPASSARASILRRKLMGVKSRPVKR